MEQIRHVIKSMPDKSEIDRRNRALIAFTLLTGARDSAIASLKMKHINMDENCLFQDARDVNTKFSKTFTTNFFPVGDEYRLIVADWVDYLNDELLYGHDDPLFPKTNVINGESRTFEASGLKREHWANATSIRKIFHDAFEAAGLPYFNPHSFRNTLAVLGEQLCRNAEEFKAWSQNLGHEGVLTTFYSYGEVQPNRQAEIIQNLGSPSKDLEIRADADEIAEAVFRRLNSQNDV